MKQNLKMASSDIVQRSYEACKVLALSKYDLKKSDKSIFLNNFKEKYECIINSPRTFERVTDLKTLLNVLEKRSALTLTDISILEYIYGVLNIKTKILENYKTLIEGEVSENQIPPNNNALFHYSSYNTAGNIPLELNGNSVKQKLSEKVLIEIITRVGSSWQELARYLKVQECKIHEISQDPSLKSHEAKTRAMLLVYEKRVLPEELKIKLLKALRLAGRMDIHDDIEKLFLRETS